MHRDFAYCDFSQFNGLYAPPFHAVVSVVGNLPGYLNRSLSRNVIACHVTWNWISANKGQRKDVGQEASFLLSVPSNSEQDYDGYLEWFCSVHKSRIRRSSSILCPPILPKRRKKRTVVVESRQVLHE